MESTDNNHDHVEDIAQIKDNKTEIDDKVAKILILLQKNEQDEEGEIPTESAEKTEIVELVHELQKQYNKIYSQYGEIKKNVPSNREKENMSSDPENYSSDESENDESDPELEFKTPREVQTPQSSKTPRKNNKIKRRRDSDFVKVLEENESSDKIKELEGQLTALRMDLESISKDKDDLEARVEEKEKEISELQSMLEGKGNEKETDAAQLNETNLQLNARISELETMLKEKENEISELTLKMEEKEKDLNWKIEALTKQLNKESALVKALKDEAKSMLEEISRRTKLERNLLKEKEGFVAQIEDLKLEVNELRETVRGKEHEEEENEIVALKEKVTNLQQELDSANGEREKLKTNSAQNLTELETEEQNKNLKDKDDLKLLKTHSLDIQKLRIPESPRVSNRVLNHHTLERKIVEHADKFQMKVENQMRLLAQRIRVAEQIQTESKESYKKILENLEQENKELNEKNLFYEAEALKIKETVLELGNFMLLEMDSIVKKVDEEHEKFQSKISRMSNEIQSVRSRITGKDVRIKIPKENVEAEKDGIEGKCGNGLEEKLRERDEMLSAIGEEKREVIRQLCLQIDYHRNRYYELKETVSKMPVTR